MRMFWVIWPERRHITEGQMRLWYADAVANGEVENTTCTDVEAMARELSNAGVLTLGRMEE